MKKIIKKAFTLVELLVVIAILAVLAGVSIVSYSSFVKKANLSADKEEVAQMDELLYANQYVQKDLDVFGIYEVLKDAGFDLLTKKARTENCKFGFNVEEQEIGLYNVVEEKLIYSKKHQSGGEMGEVVFIDVDGFNFSGEIRKDLDIKLDADVETTLTFDGTIIGNVTVDAPKATVIQNGVITGSGYGTCITTEENYVFNQGIFNILNAESVEINGYVDQAELNNTELTISTEGVIRNLKSENESTIINNGWITFTNANVDTNNGYKYKQKASSYTYQTEFDVSNVEDLLKVATKTQWSGLPYFSSKANGKASSQLVVNLKQDIDLDHILYIPMASYFNGDMGGCPERQLSLVFNGNNYEVCGLRNNFIGALGAGSKINNLTLNFNYEADELTSPFEQLFYKDNDQDGITKPYFIVSVNGDGTYNTANGKMNYPSGFVTNHYMHIGCLANSIANQTDEPVEINNLTVSGKLVFKNLRNNVAYALAIIAGEAIGNGTSSVCYKIKDLELSDGFELDAIASDGKRYFHHSVVGTTSGKSALYLGDHGDKLKIEVIYTGKKETSSWHTFSSVYPDFFTSVLGDGTIVSIQN